MDETGITVVPKSLPKVVAKKGSRSVAKIVSCERGKLVSILCCFSAAGQYIPPMFIFGRKKPNFTLINGGPEGCLALFSKNGWSTPLCFFTWLKHFAEITKPSTANPILLIFDNHSSHISIDVIEYCQAKNIILLTIPPHTSHKMQPLDVGFFGPLKKFFYKACSEWSDKNIGEKLNESSLASIFKVAYLKAAGVETSENSFRKPGIWPFNPEVFAETDFIPSETFIVSTENHGTRILGTGKSTPHHINDLNIEESVEMDDVQNILTDCDMQSQLLLDDYITIEGDNLFMESEVADCVTEIELSENSSRLVPTLLQSQNFISPFELYPIPVHTQRKISRGPKPGSSVILTDEEFKEAYVEKENKKVEKMKLKQIGTVPKSRGRPSELSSRDGISSKKIKN